MRRTVRVLALLLLIAMMAGVMSVVAIAEGETKDKEKGISVAKTTYREGETITVTAKGTGKDWVGLYLKDDTIGLESNGGVPAIYWYYAEEHPSDDIKNGISGRADFNAYKDIPAGEYKLALMANDGYEVLDEVYITVKATPEPSFVLDFTEYCENTNESWGLDEKVGNEVKYSDAILDGYLSFQATKKDPYVWIRGERADGLYELTADQLAYMVIKYRTNFDNTEGQNQGIYFYAKLSDPTAADGMSGWFSTSTPAVNDGLWHTAVADATNEKGWGNSTADIALFRFDPLEASNGVGIIGRETDVAYIAFFATREAAETYAALENIAITETRELSEGDPAILTIGGQHYAAGTAQEPSADATVSAFRLLDKDGRDTRLSVVTTDDGKTVAVDYLIPLTYRSSDKKYVYEGGATYVEAPRPTTLTATFVAEDGTIVKVVPFEAGAAQLSGVPKAPAKEGYLGKWEDYTLGDTSITIHVVYTPIDLSTDPATAPVTDPATDPATEPATDPVTDPVTDPATDPATEPATDPATEPATEPTTDPATETVADTATASGDIASGGASGGASDGCQSMVSGNMSMLLILACLAILCRAGVDRARRH